MKRAACSDLLEAFYSELTSLTEWWLEYGKDSVGGGYYGSVSHSNIPDKKADKSIILYSRLLWFFSEYARFSEDENIKKEAVQVYQFINDFFVDKECGGAYWMVDYTGQIVDDRKHSYAQAFAIYGLSVYFTVTGDASALTKAMEVFLLLEQFARDGEFGGYTEAFSRSWGRLDQVSLSEKEDNSPKTMNTNLHILEAYTALHDALDNLPVYRAKVRNALEKQLQIFCENVVDKQVWHLKMFMEADWKNQSKAYSFGHDIEASWLILKAIKSLDLSDDKAVEYEAISQNLVRNCLREGLQNDGFMTDEWHFSDRSQTPTAWWVQFEAMVGFGYAWQRDNNNEYLNALNRVWACVQEQYKDDKHGEWFWFAKKDHKIADIGYKVGPWKAPYHSGRALMELIKIFKN